MPFESTECDAMFVALVRLTGPAGGDGGGMELPGLIGPVFLSAEEGWQAAMRGDVSDAGRFQVLYARALESFGYLAELDVYVQDHPELAARYRTLGLGSPVDPRPLAPPSQLPPAPSPADTPEAHVDTARFVGRHDLQLPDSKVIVDGQTVHSVGASAVGGAFANQLLLLPYDRVKLVEYARDPQLGPLVRLQWVERPVYAVRALALASECQEPGPLQGWLRRDVQDFQVDRALPLEPQLPPGSLQLGERFSASAGQSDLYYSVFVRPVEPDGKMVTLAQALEACRNGHGDAVTEAALLRLARHEEWIPNLEMSLEQARKALAL